MVNPVPDHVVTAEQALEAARKVVERRRAGYEPPGARWTDKRITEAPSAAEQSPQPPPEEARATLPMSPPAYIPPRLAKLLAAEHGKVMMRDIQDMVCHKMHVHRDDILGPYRAEEFVKPRHISMVLCKILTHRSLPEIGYHHGGRDHTTIMNALRRYDWLVRALRERIDRGPYSLEVMVDLAILLCSGHHTWPKKTHRRSP